MLQDIGDNLHGAEIVNKSQVFCPFDNVLGILIEWGSVKQATYFLYNYKADGLLLVNSASNIALLPPRFVEGHWPFSTTPCISLDLEPEEPVRGNASKLMDTDFKRFDIEMHKIDRNVWVNPNSESQKLAGLTYSSPATNRDFRLLRSPSERPSRGVNSISTTRIVRGQDLRTTVMVRNIPNLLTYWHVRESLDRIVPGQYDFLYLRADFRTGNNVGYFFVNFTDVLVLLKYKDHVEGRTWPGFSRSEKRTKLSYADCQGTESLIDHFRNSAIMSKPYHHRPHLYYTNDDGPAAAGLEKSFPPPNNLTRLDRSLARATVEGLYVGGRATRVHNSMQTTQNTDAMNHANVVAHINAIVALNTADLDRSHEFLAMLHANGF